MAARTPTSLLLPLLLVGVLGLSACPGCGGGGPPKPATTEIALLPLGDAPPAEFAAIEEELRTSFPGLPIRVLPTEPLPEGVHQDGKLYAELLMAHYRERGPGIVLVIDEDMSTQVYTAVFSQVDFPHGNAVLSLPRFRDPMGLMPKAGSTPSAEDAERAVVRTRRQAVNATGKLLGLFPCKEERCVFHRSSEVKSLDKADGVCAKHGAMLPIILEELVKSRGGSPVSEQAADAAASKKPTEDAAAPTEVAGEAAQGAAASVVEAN